MYQPKSTEDKPETAPPERPSIAARSVAALPAPVSPKRPKLIKAAAKQAVAADAAATNQVCIPSCHILHITLVHDANTQNFAEI